MNSARVGPCPSRWALGLTCVATVIIGSPVLGLGVNLSGSAPRGLYRAVSGPAVRGALVIACLPAGLATVARTRGYLRPGACPGGVQPVLKRVGAVGGDVIDVTIERVSVNGTLVVTGPLAHQDVVGRPIFGAPRRSYRVADGELWLLGLLPRRSWDSRYFGPLPRTAVLSVVRPLLTLTQAGR